MVVQGAFVEFTSRSVISFRFSHTAVSPLLLLTMRAAICEVRPLKSTMFPSPASFSTLITVPSPYVASSVVRMMPTSEIWQPVPMRTLPSKQVLRM